MPENDTFVATIYAPITYLPASVLAYKQLDDGKRCNYFHAFKMLNVK